MDFKCVREEIDSQVASQERKPSHSDSFMPDPSLFFSCTAPADQIYVWYFKFKAGWQKLP